MLWAGEALNTSPLAFESAPISLVKQLFRADLSGQINGRQTKATPLGILRSDSAQNPPSAIHAAT